MNPESIFPNLKVYEEALLIPLQHQALWRADWHDYYSKCIYMVTLMKMPGIPSFSHIKGCLDQNRIKAWSEHSRIGQILRRNFVSISNYFPEVKPHQYIIMPDHAHLIFEVMKKTEYHFGEVVRIYKKHCSNEYIEMLGRYGFEFTGHLFRDGYNDRILRGKGQLNALYDYVRDNPRRLYLKQSYPQYFQNALMCVAGGETFGVYGNICLLDFPEKVVVRFSRSFSEQELARRDFIYKEVIRSGGVLVSPFIHPNEKRYLHMALENGGRVIYITANGFHSRWKPSKSLMDPSAEGRILFVGSAEFSASAPVLKRDSAMRMNDLADKISAIPPRGYSLRRLY